MSSAVQVPQTGPKIQNVLCKKAYCGKLSCYVMQTLFTFFKKNILRLTLYFCVCGILNEHKFQLHMCFNQHVKFLTPFKITAEDVFF